MDQPQAQNEAPLTDEERRQIRELLPSMGREIRELRTENKELKIQQQMEASERSAKHNLTKYTEEFYVPETWEPHFDDEKKVALRCLEEFMQTLQASEEAIELKKEILEGRLDDYRKRINRRHKEMKKSAMESLKNKCAGNFWVLRVEEKHGKARAKIMTPELYKDKEVTDLLSDLMKKCEKRRWGTISVASILSGVFAGKAVTIYLALGGVFALGPAIGIGVGAGFGVLILVGAGFLSYGHWPKIKEFSSKCVDKIKAKFANKRELSAVEVWEILDETVKAEHPEADNAVFIHN